jgi:nucleolar MIF4G domain-containing protein 1
MKNRSKISTQVADRKAKRREERQNKKRKRPSSSSLQKQQEEIVATTHTNKSVEPNEERTHKVKVKKEPRKRKKEKKDIFDLLDESTAAAIRKDDEEIEFLEKSLGLTKSAKDKKKLNKEYEKLEGYGANFGDFLDGLDGILENIVGDKENSAYEDMMLDEDSFSDESETENSRSRKLLLRNMQDDLDENGSSSEMSEEMVPMKHSNEYSEGYSSDDALGPSSSNKEDNMGENRTRDESSSDDDDNDDDDGEASDDAEDENDHDEVHTYQPVEGQDLYGNTIENENDNESKAKKYIPPHLRNKESISSDENKPTQLQLLDDNDPERKQNIITLQRLLNNNLNRLTDNTLESVGKSITSIFNSHEYSIRDTSECIWKNIKMACVVEHMVRSGLTPIYIACVSGVHFQAGDAVQLGGDMMERTVLALWKEIKKYRESDIETEPYSSKEAANYMLILCYLYNYGIVHCTIMYEMVRNFIKHFNEIDMELLLLILSHCGQQLRSDDPSALKDIVATVQKRSVEIASDGNKNGNSSSSSRAQFMVTAISDLKNNKRKEKDIVINEKTSYYRRVIGRMKSAVSSQKGGKTTSSNALRVTVQDILDINTNGRWWKVGAKWKGSENHGEGSKAGSKVDDSQKEKFVLDAKQKKLLTLAKRQRMNTDLRRSIFCIIMGSDDCQDAFESLVRNGMLKGRNEREVIRIIVHCCGTEKVYNPYYAFLGARICEYQSNCRFTVQLTFWDCFKQFDSMKPRKAANLAKLLAYLLMNNRLNLNVLKVIDVSPDEMSEAAIIFLTILFTNIFESNEDSEQVVSLFKRGDPSRESLEEKAKEAPEDDNVLGGNDRETLKENLSIFLLHFLQSSPKNEKKSLFRKNLKAAMKACESDGFDSMI